MGMAITRPTRVPSRFTADSGEPLPQGRKLLGQQIGAGRRVGRGGQDRHGGRVLVHIHPQIDHWASDRAARRRRWYRGRHMLMMT